MKLGRLLTFGLCGNIPKTPVQLSPYSSAPFNVPSDINLNDPMQVMRLFRKTSCIPFGVTIPDGFKDGGRKWDCDNPETVRKKPLIVMDKTKDQVLLELLQAVGEVRKRTELEKLDFIEKKFSSIQEKLTQQQKDDQSVWHDFGGDKTALLDVRHIPQEQKEILIGSLLSNPMFCRALSNTNVALLTKLVGDEAGLKVAVVRGYQGREADAWNLFKISDKTYRGLQKKGKELHFDLPRWTRLTRAKEPFVIISRPLSCLAATICDIDSETAKSYTDNNGKPLYC